MGVEMTADPAEQRRFDLRQLAWFKLLAPYALICLVCFYSVLALGRGGLVNLFLDLVYSFWSMRLVLLLPVLFMLPFARKKWCAALFLLPLFVFTIWQMASIELYAVQIRFLSFGEIADIFCEPATRPIFWEQIITFRVVLFFACFVGLYFGLDLLAERYAKSHWTMLLVPVLVAVLSLGEYMSSLHYRQGHVMRGNPKITMPWCSLNNYIQKRPVANFARAQEYLHRKDGPLWLDGPSPLFAAIPDRYHGRNIVVILLESHALRHVAGLGDGAEGHRSASPYLSALYEKGIGFTNYLQSGFSTSSAAWAILASAPYFEEAAYSPHLSKLGLIPAFQKSGYTVDWIKAADTKFAHFHELAQNLGIDAGLTDLEKNKMKAVDDTYWTAWGMPDEQIFEVSLQRVREKIQSKKPFMHVVLTVSNHIPYKYPRQLGDEYLSRDHYGGMRYTDACLERYIQELQALDESDRPIIFITADTAYRTGQYITDDDIDVAVEPVESIRIPGVLLLPDGQNFIPKVEELFCHEDLLPMLAKLVGIESEQIEPYVTKRRFAVAILDYDGFSILSERHYLYGNMALLERGVYWDYDFIEKDAETSKRLVDCFEYLQEVSASIWSTSTDGVIVRDQNWGVLGSYEYYKKHFDPNAVESGD